MRTAKARPTHSNTQLRVRQHGAAPPLHKRQGRSVNDTASQPDARGEKARPTKQHSAVLLHGAAPSLRLHRLCTNGTVASTTLHLNPMHTCGESSPDQAALSCSCSTEPRRLCTKGTVRRHTDAQRPNDIHTAKARPTKQHSAAVARSCTVSARTARWRQRHCVSARCTR